MTTNEQVEPSRFWRFCARLGYGTFSVILLAILVELISYAAFVTYHITYIPRLRSSNSLYRKAFQKCRGGGCYTTEEPGLLLSSASTAYDKYPWAEDFWKEERARRRNDYTPYEPFRMWGMLKWNGKFINTTDTAFGRLR